MTETKLVNIQTAINGLKEGKILLYPTDTVWGLGCDFDFEESYNKIHQIKKRTKEKSFVLLVDSVSMLERYIKNIPDICYDLIDLSDTPLTIIYSSPVNLPESILAKDGTIGIRVTKDPICQKIICGIAKPLISTSANISGTPTPKNYEAIDTQIKSKADMILNERLNDEAKAPSSIIRIENNYNVKVIR